MPSSSAVLAWFPTGAVREHTAAESAVTTTMVDPFCQVKMVCEKPMTPVIGSRFSGMLAGFAWSCAADEVIPV